VQLIYLTVAVMKMRMVFDFSFFVCVYFIRAS
jgi:hypothetical protein